MSHFIMLVLIPGTPGIPREDIAHEVARLLAPYDEGLETPERRVYLDAAESIRMAKHYNLTAAPQDLLAKMQDWRGSEGHLDDSGDLYYLTTYNEQAKWDWYALGGRWTGYLGAYKPDADPANFAPCWVCGATGRRDDDLGRAQRLNDPAYTCNGCQGSGKMLKDSSGWQRCADDVKPVHLIDLGQREYTPHAILTPDGVWHEQGRMGSFAMVADEKAPELWDEEATSLLAKHVAGHLAVVVDCHI